MGRDSRIWPGNLAAKMTRRGRSRHFDLYDDVLPVMAKLRGHHFKLGLVSNSHREIADFVVHHGLDVDCAVDSRSHGWIKPHESIFRAAANCSA
jgi:FMN phosphatase YigB (HAD superfamily)